jgi:hypothetical protein
MEAAFNSKAFAFTDSTVASLPRKKLELNVHSFENFFFFMG